MVPSFGAAKQTEGVTTVSDAALEQKEQKGSDPSRVFWVQLGVNQLMKYFIRREATFEVVLVVLAVASHGKQEK